MPNRTINKKIKILLSTAFIIAVGGQLLAGHTTYKEARVFACTTEQECQNVIEAAKEKRAALAEEQKGLEAKSADTKKQMENLIAQLELYQTEISALNIELTNLKDQQVQLNGSIAENKEKIKSRLVKTQLSMETNTALQFIATSTSITDFIEKVQVVNDLSEADTTLIKTLSAQIVQLKENEEKQALRLGEVEKLTAEVDKLRASKKVELDQYLAEVAQKSADQQAASNQIAVSQQQLAEIESARAAAAQAAAAEEAERAAEAARARASAGRAIEPAEVPSVPIPSNGTALQNERAAFQYFVSQGYTRAAAAGIIGNFYAESAMDPTKRQYGGGPGRGLAQWGYNMDGGRFNSLIIWARANGQSEWALDTQLAWTVHELETYGSFRSLNSALQTTNDVAYAAYYFGKIFEAPARLEDSIGERTSTARAVLARN